MVKIEVTSCTVHILKQNILLFPKPPALILGKPGRIVHASMKK